MTCSYKRWFRQAIYYTMSHVICLKNVAKQHMTPLANQRGHARVGLFHGNAMVGREGFEPSKAEPADLQSAPFGHLGTDPGVLQAIG